jgi:hypothetical protein
MTKGLWGRTLGAGGAAMRHEPHEKIVAKLFEAIECVREDVAKVEFWANAVTGFSQPIPDYQPGEVNMWVPPEQGAALKRKGN